MQFLLCFQDLRILFCLISNETFLWKFHIVLFQWKQCRPVETSFWTTVLPAKSDSDVMLCLQSYRGLRIDRSLVYLIISEGYDDYTSDLSIRVSSSEVYTFVFSFCNCCYHVAASVVSFDLICNITTFRKKYSLTFWPHPLGQGCVCGQNICYSVAASIVSFNLICNMTIFWKSLILASGPHPLSPPKGLGPRPSNWNPVWYVSYLLLLCLHAKYQQKILTIALVIAELKYLTFDPLSGVKGGGVKLWHFHAHPQALGNHGL